MMEFSSSSNPSKGLTSIIANLNDLEFFAHGKRYLIEVIAEVIKQLVMVHRVELEFLVTEYIASKECNEYIISKIKERIDKQIEEDIKEMFKK